MASSPDKNRVAEALNCLRTRNEFFEFDNQERVVRVSVYDAEGADEIAAHVGNLTDIERLKFSGTDLTDRGLSRWTGLVHLKELWIGGAEITAAGLRCLAGMSQLGKLYIQNAGHLDRAAFERIAIVTSLRRLSLEHGRYNDADLSPLAGLTNLEELSLSENDQISGTFCRYLTELPRLQELNPGEYVTDEGLVEIARLPHLETLYLDGPFTDAGLARLSTLQKLKSLFITSQRITGPGLAVVFELPALTYLGLRGTLSSDVSVPAIAQCKRLECVTFLESELSDEGRRQLRDALPDCQINEYGRSE